MALPVQQFPILTPSQMGAPGAIAPQALDFFNNATKSAFALPSQYQNLMQQMYENQIKQAQAHYAEPMAQAELKKAQLVNQYYGPLQESLMNLQGAQAYQDIQTGKKTAFEVANPQYIDFAAWYATRTHPELFGGTPINGGQPGAGGGGNPPVSGSGGSSGQTQKALATQPQSQQTYTTDDQGNTVLRRTKPGEIIPDEKQDATGQQYGRHGVLLPTLGATAKDPILAHKIGVTPMDKGAIDIYNQQVLDEAKKKSESLSMANNNATSMSQGVQTINAWDAAMDQSQLTGVGLGQISPHSALGITLGVGKDWSPEQISDYLSSKAIPLQISYLRNSMGQARFTNTDMNIAKDMTTQRVWDHDARKFNVSFMNAADVRMREVAQIRQKLQRDNLGASNEVIDGLVRDYQNDYPIAGKTADGKPVVKHSNLNKWLMYTTPTAIASERDHGHYVPPKAGKNTMLMMYPDGNVYPIKKKKVADEMQNNGARPIS